MVRFPPAGDLPDPTGNGLRGAAALLAVCLGRACGDHGVRLSLADSDRVDGNGIYEGLRAVTRSRLRAGRLRWACAPPPLAPVKKKG